MLQKPLILYSSFDILYGPSQPTLEETGAQMALNLGASFAMMGPKGGKRWPWNKRYNILDTIIKNKYSPLYRYLRDLKLPFTITISPFVDLSTVLLDSKNVNPEEMYKYMIHIFQKSLKKQYSKIPSVSQW